MKNKKNKTKLRYGLFSFWRFVLYFSFSAFVVTCSFLLFFGKSSPAFYDNLYIPNKLINKSAFTIFLNILFICAALSLIDIIKKRIFVGAPVNRILNATQKITQGDFSARIKPVRRGFIIKDELDVIIENFNKMAQELSSIETLKTDFIANVSHELKTPLSVIQNYSTLLQTPGLSEEERTEYSKALHSASSNLTDLVNNILRLNKLENQLVIPTKEQYSLTEQLCECMIMFEQKWEEKSLKISTQLDENILIYADRELLSIVWSNLFSNAIKFNREGGSVFISCEKKGRKAIVTVKDTGCGISEKTGKHIFEKFYQGDTSHSTAGNGLGLALVKRVIDITDGEISVQSKLNEGTSFTVSVPLK